MTDKVLKAYIKDKYFLKVKKTKGWKQKYYTMSYMYDSQGGSWSPTELHDTYGEAVAYKLFDSLSEIIDVCEKCREETLKKRGKSVL